MKLMTEIRFNDVESVLEESQDGNKEYHIQGIFMEADVLNGNKRIYPEDILAPQVLEYNKIVENGMAYGELDHPQSATVTMQNASHRIKELYMDGKSVMGKAVLLDNVHGRTAQSALKSGGRLAVSSRGLGSLNEGNVVAPNFKLVTIDIVSNPSAPNAFVDGILENKEWILEGDDFIERKLQMLDNALASKGSVKAFEVINQWIKYL